MSTVRVQDNYDGIQALRFFAAFLVVVTHSTFYTFERLVPGNGFWPDGATGVNIFFVISGFVMVVSIRSFGDEAVIWKVFAWRRLIRIVPMYWVATTIKLAAMIAIPTTILHSEFGVLHIISSYLFIPTTNSEGQYKPLLAVGWTLYFEMFFYVIFTASLFFKKNIYLFVGILLGACSLLSLLRTSSSPAGMMFFDPIVLQFYFGMLLAEISKRFTSVESAMSKYPLIPAMLSATGIVLLLLPLQVTIIHEALRTGVPAAMVVLGVIWLEPSLKDRIPKSLLLLGDASYSLYLFHPLIVPVVPTVLQKLGVQNYWLSVMLSIVIAISAGLAIYLIIERPVTKWLRLLNVARRAPQPA